MKVSIIIPNYNSEIIGQTLESIYRQSISIPYDVIVVGVDSYGIVNQFPGVKIIDTGGKCPPAKARNIGSRISNGEILIFLDADCVVSDNWLGEILEPFNDPLIAAVGGGVRIPKNNFWSIADNLAMFYSFLYSNRCRQVTQLPSLNLAVRRNSFVEVGEFDESYILPSGEDFALTMRLAAQGKLFFKPKAWVWHKPPRNDLWALIHHAYNQGKYSTKVDWRYSAKINFPFRNSIVLILLAPFLALFTTIKVFLTGKNIKYIYVFPAILISKLAWCFGASKSPYLAHRQITYE